MSTEIVEHNNNVPTVAASVSLMQMALEKNYPLEQIEKMMELQDRFDAKEAKKAFIRAMAEFKSQPIILKKDLFNNQFKSWYSSIGSLLNGALPRMGECGLTHRWDIDQSNPPMIKITCIVTHEMGHSESTFMVAPPDKSGAKNPIQEIKSTRTYLQAATFESIMGLAATNANVDDDGNGATVREVQFLGEKQISQIIDMMNAAHVDHADYLKYLEVETVEQIPASRFKAIVAELDRIAKGAK